MPFVFDSKDAGFESKISHFLTLKRTSDADVNDITKAIITEVRTRGDQALIDFTNKFDSLDITPETIQILPEDITSAGTEVPDPQIRALEYAADRIHAYHARQKPQDRCWIDERGVEVGWKWSPIERVGLYVPGGAASYPSSVLMNAIPAYIAGVKNLTMCVPTPNGVCNPLVLLAAKLCRIKTVYRIGGAQAIAAMAYGTETINPVDKIVGPGNAYVAAAKRHVFGRVGIDMVAGPSEITIIADKNNHPDWIAADLMSQAEHDTKAQAILITTSATLARSVQDEITKLLKTLPRSKIAAKSWEDFGAIIVVKDLSHAQTLANKIAPEHLALCVEDPKSLAQNIFHAGALFLGSYTPEAIGDYVAGPNHVLPTSRSARFSSGLSVVDFMKRTTQTRLTKETILSLGPHAACLAEAEGLKAHALSVRYRLDALKP